MQWEHLLNSLKMYFMNVYGSWPVMTSQRRSANPSVTTIITQCIALPGRFLFSRPWDQHTNKLRDLFSFLQALLDGFFKNQMRNNKKKKKGWLRKWFEWNTCKGQSDYYSLHWQWTIFWFWMLLDQQYNASINAQHSTLSLIHTCAKYLFYLLTNKTNTAQPHSVSLVFLESFFQPQGINGKKKQTQKTPTIIQQWVFDLLSLWVDNVWAI